MTLLVLGIDIEDQAESIYLVEIDSSREAVAITTFPPSLVVDVAGLEYLSISETSLKMVYYYGLRLPNGDEVSATNLLAQALVDNFDLAPDHYILVNERPLASMIDTMGGIDVTLPVAFEGIGAGNHHFDGSRTWWYVRTMSSPGIMTELPRIERQKHVLEGLRDKLLSISILPIIPDLLQEFVEDVAMLTDLSALQILELIRVLENTPEDQYIVTVIS
jgi:LCP family protein required for cell wall assembly